MDRLLAGLTPDNAPLAAEIAALPLAARGFGPVKADQERRVQAKRDQLWARWPGERAALAA